jgi:hypothetical protein
METEKSRSLSKGQKVALWIALVWLLFCILGAIGNSWFFIMVVCIGLFAAIICIFKKMIDAKYAWTVFAVSLIIPFVMIGALASPEEGNTKQEIEKGKGSKDVVKEEPKNSKSIDKTEKKQEPVLSAKEKEIAEVGYKKGILYGYAGADNNEFSNMLDIADHVEGLDEKVNEVMEEMAGREYDNEFNTPSNAEEKKLKKIYIENFIKGMNETMDALGN